MKKLFTFLVLALIAGGGWYAFKMETAGAPPQAGAQAQQPQGPMPATVAAVISREITEWSEFSGRLRAVEDVQVRPRVSGTIDAVHFREGDVVKKGDRLFTIDLRPYKAALAQVDATIAAARARVELTKSDFERAQGIFAQRAIPERELDARNNAYKEAQAALKSAQASRELAALNLEYAEMTAPITGRVGRVDITVGNIVEAGGQAPVLTTIQSVDPIYLDFDIDEQTYLRVMKSVRGDNKSADMPVFMTLSDESEFIRQGRILSFDNQLSGDSGTLRVRAEFPNADGLLTPGLFARVRVGGAEPRAALLINDAAVGTDQDRKFVYAVDASNAIAYRPVVLGPISDGLRVVRQGLNAGELIVVNGLQRIHPGMPVQPVIVEMQAPAGAASAPPQAEQQSETPAGEGEEEPQQP